MKAPETYKGKHLVFEERFESNTICSNELSAKCVLESIRLVHHHTKGWVELDAGIEPVEGGFRAYRHHAQYR